MNWKYVSIIASFFFLCGLGCGFGCILLYFWYPISFQVHVDQTSHYFQIMELDLSNNQTEYGFVKLKRNLEKEEFISYRNWVSGKHIVISNFGTEEYTCSGSCLCDDDDDSTRRSSTVLTRSLFLALSTLSTSLALRIAEEAFRDDCIENFSDVCRKEDIVSEVAKCRARKPRGGKDRPDNQRKSRDHDIFKKGPVDYRKKWQSKRHKQFTQKTLLKGHGIPERNLHTYHYKCVGNCVLTEGPAGRWRLDEEAYEKGREEGKIPCEKLETTGGVMTSMTGHVGLRTAKDFFVGDFLSEFCFWSSEVIYDDPDIGSERPAHVCSAGLDDEYPNVECVFAGEIPEGAALYGDPM